MWWNTVLLAFRELRRNVLRSSLTILGIVIGVAAVITMVTLGRGATAQVTSDIASLGSNMLQVRPGARFGGAGVREAAKPLEVEDAEAIASEVSSIVAVAPSASQNALAVYGNINWTTSVIGTTNDFLKVRDWPLTAGREFADGELRGGKAVCILGATVRRELFEQQDPVGNTMRLGSLSCQVIGVLTAKGMSTFGRDQDDLVIIPLRTFQRRIAGNQNVSNIYVSAADVSDTEKVKSDIEALMRQRRHIARNAEDDFNVRDMQEIVTRVTGTTEVLTSLLGAVAAVSLLVGGIGIMNIMLVSVTERTREIGIRLAIGALEHDVMRQFLVEAVVLSSLGGVIGIALGLSGSAALAPSVGVQFVLDPVIVLVAFVFSAVVGVLFGYFPARKAARLNPIDALRHE